MLADVGGHGDVRGDRRHGAEDLARLEQLVAQVVLDHAARLLHPLLMVLLGDAGEQQLQHDARVAGDVQRGRNVLVDLGAVDVDVQHLGAGGEGFRLAQRAVGEANADGDEQVAALHGDVRRVRAVHAEHAEHAVAAGGHRAQAHQRGDDGRVRAVGQLQQLLLRAGEDDAAAAVDQRAVRLGDELRGALQPRLGLDLVALERLALGAQLRGRVLHGQARDERLAGERGIFGLGDLHVLGDVDEHGAGAAGARDVERLADGIGEPLHARDHVVVLGDGHRDAGNVGLLEGVGAHERLGHVAGDEHDRRGVHICGGDGGDEVRRAGAAGGDAHACAAGRAGVAVGGMTRVLFMRGQNVADAVLPLVQLVVDRQHSASGKAEDDARTLLNEAFDQDCCSVEFHVHFSFSGLCPPPLPNNLAGTSCPVLVARCFARCFGVRAGCARFLLRTT